MPPCTLHPAVDFGMARGSFHTLFTHAYFSLSLHELLNTHALQICVLAIVAHLHAGDCCCYSCTSNFASSQLLLFTHEPRKSCSFLTGSDCFSHAQEFLGFTHVIFFCGLVDGAAVSLPHELNYGFGVDCYSCPSQNSVNSFCRKVCVSLPVASLSRMDC